MEYRKYIVTTTYWPIDVAVQRSLGRNLCIHHSNGRKFVTLWHNSWHKLNGKGCEPDGLLLSDGIASTAGSGLNGWDSVDVLARHLSAGRIGSLELGIARLCVRVELPWCGTCSRLVHI